ncbi:hypothetical protein SNEBB_004679 [Seison nebaliae]|nr:hypothetical protein SNEBB_004679 [Seison nebaliae]
MLKDSILLSLGGESQKTIVEQIISHIYIFFGNTNEIWAEKKIPRSLIIKEEDEWREIREFISKKYPQLTCEAEKIILKKLQNKIYNSKRKLKKEVMNNEPLEM